MEGIAVPAALMHANTVMLSRLSPMRTRVLRDPFFATTREGLCTNLKCKMNNKRLQMCVEKLMNERGYGYMGVQTRVIVCVCV